VEKGHNLNNLVANIGNEDGLMDPGTYFALIIHVLMVLIFIVLILAFLYMIYGREKKPE